MGMLKKTELIILALYIVLIPISCNISSPFVNVMQDKTDDDLRAIYGAVGVLDTAFNSTGFVTHSSARGKDGFPDYGSAVALDADGKILVAGRSGNGTVWSMVIWRYNNDGTPDTTFNSKGYTVCFDEDDNWGYSASSIILDSNGKILVTGYRHNDPSYWMEIWRYNSDGTLDTTFNGSGAIWYTATTHDSGMDITLDKDGNILVIGYNISIDGLTRSLEIWKYSSSGSLDTSFGTDGVVLFTEAESINMPSNILIDSSGRILISGYHKNTNGDNDIAVWRYNSDGTLDTSFNSIGFKYYNGGSYDTASGMVLDSDGNILITGSTYNGSDQDIIILKYKTDGTLDTSFSGDGIAVFNYGNDEHAKDIVLDRNGRIIVSSQIKNIDNNNDMGLLRFNSDGTPDKTFNSNSGYTVHNGAAGGNGDDSGYSLVIDPMSKIIVTGYSESETDIDMAIWKYK